MSKETRQYKDRAEYIKRKVSERRRRLKQLAIEYKGGKCSLCGYCKCTGALEFHHIDPKTKDFSLSTDGLTRSWKRIKVELDKCILVCSNCHKEIHSETNNLSLSVL